MGPSLDKLLKFEKLIELSFIAPGPLALVLLTNRYGAFLGRHECLWRLATHSRLCSYRVWADRCQSCSLHRRELWGRRDMAPPSTTTPTAVVSLARINLETHQHPLLQIVLAEFPLSFSPAPATQISHNYSQFPIRRRRPDGKWRKQLTGSKTYAALGWSAFAIGNIMRFVSMRFAAQTVLSGLGSLQFVVIPAASRQLLGIKPQLSTALGVGTVLVGNVLIIAYGPPETTFTLEQLRHQWGTPPMRAFLFALGFSLISLHFLWRVIHRQRRQVEAEQRALRQRRREASLGGDEDLALWEIPGSKEADLGDPSTSRMFVAALLFSAVSSFIGAWSVLFSKSLTYVVSSAPESLWDWYSWFTVAAFLGTAGYWIRQSNKGLKLYPTTLIMPLMQAFWMAMSVLEGVIYFDEMSTLSNYALSALLLGLLLAIIGAVAMG